MKQISFTLGDSEFDKFMELLKSFNSAKNIQSKELDESGDLGLTNEHKQIIEQRRINHLTGKSKSFSLEEVKANARKSKA